MPTCLALPSCFSVHEAEMPDRGGVSELDWWIMEGSGQWSLRERVSERLHGDEGWQALVPEVWRTLPEEYDTMRMLIAVYHPPFTMLPLFCQSVAPFLLTMWPLRSTSKDALSSRGVWRSRSEEEVSFYLIVSDCTSGFMDPSTTLFWGS